MASIKNPKRTAQRIIAMVESGDYDPLIIEHMVESIGKSHVRKIKHLQQKAETAAKPSELIVAHSRIVGALRDTIKQHGAITLNSIGSAAKRIEGNLKQVANQAEPIEPASVRLLKGKVTVERDKVSCHKLTVARDGDIRIKIAIGSGNEEANKITERFITVAVDAINLNKGTLRGKLKLGDIYKPFRGITMYNDSKSEKINFKL